MTKIEKVAKGNYYETKDILLAIIDELVDPPRRPRSGDLFESLEMFRNMA